MADWVLQRLGKAAGRQPQMIRDGSAREDREDLFGKLGPGYRIGSRYELDTLLADHGSIRVYKGRSLRSGRPRAIRAVDKNVFHRQFYPVLNITKQIWEDQLFVQRVLKIMEQDGLVFVSENWFEGESLHELLNRSGCPGEKVCADWMIQLCGLIDALHHMERPIIFRDIKPENIILHKKKDHLPGRSRSHAGISAGRPGG
jgi:serine/threonine protein kinase